MNISCPLGGTCWLSCILLCAGWLLVSSALLYYSWNKVVCALTSMKKVKYWQPLLVLATISVLCMPCMQRKHGCCNAKKGECPYEQKAGGEAKH